MNLDPNLHAELTVRLHQDKLKSPYEFEALKNSVAEALRAYGREVFAKTVKMCVGRIEDAGWLTYDGTVNAKKHTEALSQIVSETRIELVLGEGVSSLACSR